MRRGTTPTVKINVDGISVTELDEIYLTFEQRGLEITKRETDITKDTIGGKNMLKVNLTQEETLSFKDGNIQIQFRAKTLMGTVVASTIVTDTLEHILMEGEI